LVATENPEEWQLEDTPYYELNKKGKLVKKHSVRMVFGKQWGLSQSLGKYKSAVECRDGEIGEELGRLYQEVKDLMKDYDYCTVYWISWRELEELGCHRLVEILEEYVSKVEEENP
jgi:hypothetical protein